MDTDRSNRNVADTIKNMEQQLYSKQKVSPFIKKFELMLLMTAIILFGAWMAWIFLG